MLLNSFFSLSDNDVLLHSTDQQEDVEVSAPAGQEGNRHIHKELKVSAPRPREDHRLAVPSTLQKFNRYTFDGWI